MELLGLFFILGTIVIAFIVGQSMGKVKTQVVYRDREAKTKIVYRDRIVRVRAEAVKQSKMVIKGKVAERLAPFLPDFPISPADCSFVNFAVDYIGLPGYTEENISEIVFIEIKTGKSNLGTRQRQVRDCISKGRIRFVVYNPNLEEK